MGASLCFLSGAELAVLFNNSATERCSRAVLTVTDAQRKGRIAQPIQIRRLKYDRALQRRRDDALFAKKKTGPAKAAEYPPQQPPAAPLQSPKPARPVTRASKSYVPPETPTAQPAQSYSKPKVPSAPKFSALPSNPAKRPAYLGNGGIPQKSPNWTPGVSPAIQQWLQKSQTAAQQAPPKPSPKAPPKPPPKAPPKAPAVLKNQQPEPSSKLTATGSVYSHDGNEVSPQSTPNSPTSDSHRKPGPPFQKKKLRASTRPSHVELYSPPVPNSGDQSNVKRKQPDDSQMTSATNGQDDRSEKSRSPANQKNGSPRPKTTLQVRTPDPPGKRIIELYHPPSPRNETPTKDQADKSPSKIANETKSPTTPASPSKPSTRHGGKQRSTPKRSLEIVPLELYRPPPAPSGREPPVTENFAVRANQIQSKPENPKTVPQEQPRDISPFSRTKVPPSCATGAAQLYAPPSTPGFDAESPTVKQTKESHQSQQDIDPNHASKAKRKSMKSGEVKTASQDSVDSPLAKVAELYSPPASQRSGSLNGTVGAATHAAPATRPAAREPVVAPAGASNPEKLTARSSAGDLRITKMTEEERKPTQPALGIFWYNRKERKSTGATTRTSKDSFAEMAESGQLKTLSVTELKVLCKERGLRTNGMRLVVAQRLIDYHYSAAKELC